MLQLKNISKTYSVGDIKTEALRDVSLSFREKEFVAILGHSGSGKTTCLNIIGGLDRYDKGDLIIKGKSTRKFTDKDWDAYRNNSIGFVFQSYNLITHLSIVANVEMAMTLSGVTRAEKHQRALEVLKKVGLEDHLHKKPNQLSGGQMQRVAIARALVNNPEILLCDEPTGALDSETSVQIMDLIKEVAHERLVIMVTHNAQLAETYADRIVNFADGLVVADSNPYDGSASEEKFALQKTKMSYFTALGLSFNNLRTKLGRTFLTCFASSIGIIGIAVILSLSTGFQKQIDDYQADALSEFPIIISQSAVEMDMEQMQETTEEMMSMFTNKEFADTDYVALYNPADYTAMHTNILSGDFLEYLSEIDPEICKGIGVTRVVGMNLLRETDDGIIPVSMPVGMTGSMTGGITSMSSSGMTSYPEVLDKTSPNYIEQNYDLLYGEYPAEATDIVLLVDSRNRIDVKIMRNMGFDTENIDEIDFSDIVGTEIALVSNDDYYVQGEYGNFVPSQNYEAMISSDDTLNLKVSGIIRQKESVDVSILGSTFIYSDELARLVVDRGQESKIVKAQEAADINVITMEQIDDETKANVISYLGGDTAPAMIMIFPVNFESKDAVLEYLDAYNRSVKDDADLIVYTDLASTMTEMTGSIMDAITVVLIAFAAISLVVSLIMICIITYTSVLERTKEIGILKALGARKKDITRVFDAETFILGVFSGVLGVVIAGLLTIPINNLLENISGLPNVAVLRVDYAIYLVIISTLLTVLGGHIPARMASRKDAVEALRSE